MKRLLLPILLLSLIFVFSIQAQEPLAPEPVPGEVYYAPFPHTVSLDGDLADWENVPTATVPVDADLSSDEPAITFAAAADDEYLYVMADVIDNNIVTGEHGEDWWNEDSVEFYVNATGDFTLSSYGQGVAQLTVPPINMDSDELILGGNQGPATGADATVVKTEQGYAVEVAFPLESDFWSITPTHGGELGFNVHLNGASELNRDTKLIWSNLDTSDQSYQNPSVFGTLVFAEIGNPTVPGAPLVVADFEEGLWAQEVGDGVSLGFISWGDTEDNTVIETVTIPADDELALPDQAGENSVLKVDYDIASWGGFTHTLSEDGATWTGMDWSEYNGIGFWMYGTESGGEIMLELQDNRAEDTPGDTAERFAYRFNDDWAGWQYFSLPWAAFERRTDFQPAGAPDDGELGLTDIGGYAFGMPAGTGAHTTYVDEVALLTRGVTPLEAPEDEEMAAGPSIEREIAYAPYHNPRLPVAERVDDLLARMTLAEKIGQMTLVEKGSIEVEDIGPLAIGGLLSGGGGYPDTENTPEAWAQMVNDFQNYAVNDSRLGIPVIYGVDAVHGHNNVVGATIFPHNVGLGAARNAELVHDICRATAVEMVATGIYWNYSPVVAVPRDIRWGRTYEGYAEDTELVTELALACMEGLQGDDLADPTTVLATPKHYVGDGGAVWGTSTTGSYEIDQGVTDVDEETLREIHLPPYEAAIDAGAENIMISFSSWGGIKMHGQDYLINDVLKGELGFPGFIVSDWQGIDQIEGDYYSDVVTSINAGIDMVMVPYNYQQFIDTLTEAVENGDVPEERIDDAVRRILTTKYELGLFEWAFADPQYLAEVGSDEHRELGRQAVAETLVLLKNEDATLPLPVDTPNILVAGQAANDIGIQSGGWTIEWQGNTGDITPGTTILEGIEATATGEVVYEAGGEFADLPQSAEVAIVVVGERPYAEGVGDSADLALPEADLEVIEKTAEHAETLVIVVLSGRPVIITEQMAMADAVVAAWLPGTEGQGVVDGLFGRTPINGELPFTWPASIEQIPFDFGDLTEDDYLFPYGYGLETEAVMVE